MNLANKACAADARGNSIVVWPDNRGLGYSILHARLDGASRLWRPSRELSAGAGGVRSLKIASNHVGTVMAVWDQTESLRTRIWAARYHVAIDIWEPPEVIEFDETGRAQSARVMVNAGGDAVVSWIYPADSTFSVGACRFDAAAAAWSPPQRLNLETTGSAGGHEVLVHDGGSAEVNWLAVVGTRRSAWTCRYDEETCGWEPARRLNHRHRAPRAEQAQA